MESAASRSPLPYLVLLPAGLEDVAIVRLHILNVQVLLFLTMVS